MYLTICLLTFDVTYRISRLLASRMATWRLTDRVTNCFFFKIFQKKPLKLNYLGISDRHISTHIEDGTNKNEVYWSPKDKNTFGSFSLTEVVRRRGKKIQKNKAIKLNFIGVFAFRWFFNLLLFHLKLSKKKNTIK